MTRAVRVASGALVALAVLLVLAGHPFRDSLAASAMVLVQVASGVAVWSRLERGRGGDALGTMAVGAALGIAASCASSVALVATPMRPVSWAVPAAAASVALVAMRFRRGNQPVPSPSRHDWTWLVIVLATGLATEWTWMLPLVAALVAAAWAWSTGPFRGRRRSRSTTWIAGSAAAALAVVQIVLVRMRSPYWTQFRQSVLDIPDHTFFDALARGTARWGGAGTDIVGAGLGGAGYHWLSYHWAGSIVLATGSTSPALASHLVQVALGAVALALVRTVAVRLGAGPLAGFLAALACAAMVAAPVPLLQALVAYSPSHVAGLAMVLAVVVAADPGTRVAPSARAAAVALLSAAAVGMKATSLVPLAAVAAVVLVGRPRPSPAVPVAQRVALVASIAAPSLAALAFFFGRRLGNATDTSLIPFDVVSSDGPLAAGSGPLLVGMGTIALLGSLGCTVAGIVLVRRTRVLQQPAAAALLLAAAVLVVTGFVYVGSRIGVNYFFNVAIALVLPVAAAAASRAGRAGPGLTARTRALITVAALVVQVAWSSAFYRIDPSGSWGGAVRSLLMLAPVALALVVAAFARGTSARRLLAGSVAAMLVPAASFVAWVPRYAVVHLRAAEGFDASDAYSGRDEYRDALSRLGRIAGEGDVIATNRFCSDDAARYPDCYAAWSLVAAATGRRVYVEIPEFAYFVTPEMADRVTTSIAFVDAPSGETAAKLSTASVRWVYVDKAVTDARSWEPWARIEYENDLAAVLRLLP